MTTVFSISLAFRWVESRWPGHLRSREESGRTRSLTPAQRHKDLSSLAKQEGHDHDINRFKET